MKTIIKFVLIILVVNLVIGIELNKDLENKIKQPNSPGYISQIRNFLKENAQKLFEISLAFNGLNYCKWIECSNRVEGIAEEKRPVRVFSGSHMSAVTSFNQLLQIQRLNEKSNKTQSARATQN